MVSNVKKTCRTALLFKKINSKKTIATTICLGKTPFWSNRKLKKKDSQESPNFLIVK
jgi:hypothetical protein